MIKELIINYWQVLLLKETPANTPYSRLLLLISAILLLLVLVIEGFLSTTSGTYDLLGATVIACSILVSFLLYNYILLFITGLEKRLVQTTTCLFCAHILIHVLASPLFLLDPYLSPSNLKNPLLLLLAVIYLFISLGLSVWQFVVNAHIYKEALNASAIQSVLAAFGLIAVNILTVSFWR